MKLEQMSKLTYIDFVNMCPHLLVCKMGYVKNDYYKCAVCGAVLGKEKPFDSEEVVVVKVKR